MSWLVTALIISLVAAALAYAIWDNLRQRPVVPVSPWKKFSSGEYLPEPPPPVPEINSAEFVLLMKRGKA